MTPDPRTATYDHPNHEPFVKTETHEGVPVLLLDPYYNVVRPERPCLTAEDPDSFLACVAAIAGPNNLVELRSDGGFFYHDALGAPRNAMALYKLERDIASSYLTGFSVTQRDLLRLHEQMPHLLTPQSGGDEVWEIVQRYKLNETKTVEATNTDDNIGLTVNVGKTATGVNLPRYWLATNPWYKNGRFIQTVLRLEVELPNMQPDGAVQGQVVFGFSLWNPDAQMVRDLALDYAASDMQDLFGDTKRVIRGAITMRDQ